MKSKPKPKPGYGPPKGPKPVKLDYPSLVSMFGDRACLTAWVVLKFPEALRRWVEDNCDHDLNADVWLLPVPETS